MFRFWMRFVPLLVFWFVLVQVVSEIWMWWCDTFLTTKATLPERLLGKGESKTKTLSPHPHSLLMVGPLAEHPEHVYMMAKDALSAVGQLLKKDHQQFCINREGAAVGEVCKVAIVGEEGRRSVVVTAGSQKGGDAAVSRKKFRSGFGVEWEVAVQREQVFSAKSACQKLGIKGAEMKQLWESSPVVALDNGYYCAKVEDKGGNPMYVLNGFPMEVPPDYPERYASVRWCEFQWDRSSGLPPFDWGPLVQQHLLAQGLKLTPADRENVTVCNSAIEALAKRMCLIGIRCREDHWCNELLEAGVPERRIKDLCANALVTMDAGKGSADTGGKPLPAFEWLQNYDFVSAQIVVGSGFGHKGKAKLEPR